MLNRYSILCFATGASLLAAKLAAVAANPLSASTGFFPQLVVVAVVFALIWTGLRARSTPGERPVLRRRAFLLVTAGWVMTGFILTIAWVDHNLAQRTNETVYDEPHKVWATRGLVTDGTDGAPIRVRNSIESISYAFERGARGTELDAYYDTEMSDFRRLPFPPLRKTQRRPADSGHTVRRCRGRWLLLARLERICATWTEASFRLRLHG